MDWLRDRRTAAKGDEKSIAQITFHIELENKAALTALLANLKARGATLLEVIAGSRQRLCRNLETTMRLTKSRLGDRRNGQR